MQSDDCDKSAAGASVRERASFLFSYLMMSLVSVTYLSPFFSSFGSSCFSALQKTDLGQGFYTVASGKNRNHKC